MSNSPRVKQLPPRPKITLPVPGQYMGYPQTPMTYVGTPFGQTPIPMTPISGQPQVMYANKASAFMFTQFRGIKDWTKSGLSVGEKSAFWLYGKVSSWSKRWFTHIFLFLVVFVYSVGGALIFITVEGAHENQQKKDMEKDRDETVAIIRKLEYDFDVKNDPDLWTGRVTNQLKKYESLLFEAFKDGSFESPDGSTEPVWTFWNSVFYCGTIYTTIGYGHISPRTMAGRAITIVYAIFGIPIFLIILADFGKLFTRGIKFLWAFVRRLYYTGSCKKVRRTGPVQEVMKGVQLVYDLATFRRPSQFNPEDIEEMQKQQIHTETILNLDGNASAQPDTPGTPAMSNFAIDDEFNLPISVAISILLGYIFVGATAYHMFEEWDFFESFYFVFISMSTIGFGDFVPKNPIFMMFSIVYLVFGLALTSMCINVVQTVLSDSFKQASQKISATIGFEVPPEEGGEEAGVQVQVLDAENVEIDDVQDAVKGDEGIHEAITAPKAKQEDVDV